RVPQIGDPRGGRGLVGARVLVGERDAVDLDLVDVLVRGRVDLDGADLHRLGLHVDPGDGPVVVGAVEVADEADRALGANVAHALVEAAHWAPPLRTLSAMSNQG